MWQMTLKSLLAHRTRLALTALAVVLGVAFVSGTLVLTDTMRGTFNTLMTDAYAGVDVVVQGPETFSSALGGGTTRGPVPAEVLDQVDAVDGVAMVEGEVQGQAILLDEDGQRLGTPTAPSLGGQVPADDELYAVELRDGRYPTVAGEVAIDAGTAGTYDLTVGDVVDVVTTGPATTQTITGIVGYGEADNLAGASLTLFDPATAFDLFAVDGGYAALNVEAEPGVTRDALADRVAAAVDGTLQVLTGDEMGASASAEIADSLGFLNTALLAFAGLSLFVGAFIIFNTFSILVAQRTRELALLRAVGASRRQVLGSMLSEALATGLVGSVVGIGAGLGVAAGLRAVMDGAGMTLPEGSLVFAGRTVVVGLLVGVVVTVVAALGPALRSLRVPPVAAMQAVAVPPPTRLSRTRLVLGSLLTVAGIGALTLGLFAEGGMAVVAVGAALVIFGFALLAALVTRPVLTVMGWPVERGLGVRGELATQNALRNPRRTASTASALMIGLGLVSFVVIFAASITASTAATITDTFRAELSVRPAAAGPGGFSPEVVEVLAAVDGVETAMPMVYADFRYDDKVLFGTGLDPVTYDEVIAMDTVEGNLADLDGPAFAVKSGIAEAEGWQVGDVVDLEFAATGVQSLRLAAIVESDVDVSWYFANDTLRANLHGDPQVGQVFVSLVDGVELDAVRPAIDAALAAFPTVESLDQAELQADIEGQIDQILGLMTALLLLSIVIALFGLVNTLGLSVYERVRELGLLRAVGASTRQVRAMVRWEAVLIAGLGATLGLAVGTLFGWLLVTALADEGISTFTMPVAQLGSAFVLACVAGVLAAVVPARRAGRVDILDALQMS